MDDEAYFDLRTTGAFGALASRILSNIFQWHQTIPHEKSSQINQHMIGQLCGYQNLDKNALAPPSWIGNFYHRIFSISKKLDRLHCYQSEFEKLRSQESDRQSDLLSRQISFYLHDIYVLRERLRKLAYDASHLVKAGIEPSELWRDGKPKGKEERNGIAGEEILKILEQFKGISETRNQSVHSWDYEDEFIARLSLLETFISCNAFGTEVPRDVSLLVSEHTKLIEQESKKWSDIATKNTFAAIKITDELIKFIEPKIHLD